MKYNLILDEIVKQNRKISFRQLTVFGEESGKEIIELIDGSNNS